MQPLLQIENLNKSYSRPGQIVSALQNIELAIYPGEFLGLIGESGCGKSTLARLIAGLERADTGSVTLNGAPATMGDGVVQLVFQSPLESFNPRLTLGESIEEGLHNRKLKKAVARQKSKEYLQLCGLSEEFAQRYPHQTSGGECQRAAIARALVLNPKLIICDEPTSALDVSSQAQVINLLNSLKQKQQLACLFITHDIALAQQVCDRLAIMWQGRILECASSETVINKPQASYTRQLLAITEQLYQL